MGLSDLMKEIKQDSQTFLGDETMESKVLNQVLKLVEDKISEVKNQAVKWCASNLSKYTACSCFRQSRPTHQDHPRTTHGDDRGQVDYLLFQPG
jgi:hypothetical protein